MIDAIDIRNFRCFQHLHASHCSRINVLVGDNGAGKTSFLEALFMTLSGNVEVSLRLKAARGFNTAYNAPPKGIEEAIWRDYFYELDWNNTIQVALEGNGPAARSMTISRGPSDTIFGLKPSEPIEYTRSAPLTFTWRDFMGEQYVVVPKISPQSIEFGVPLEDLPDFFLFSANQTVSSSENAARFSELSKERREDSFVNVFTREYPWIEDLSIEVSGGFPVIHATLKGEKNKIPLNAVSGGINRVVSIMLAIASRPNSVVIVDEIEDGIYHKHKTSIWRGLLSLARTHNSQMFLSTHDEEWLQSLIEASGDEMDDISLWRLERDRSGARRLKQFSGRSFKAGIEAGGEVR